MYNKRNKREIKSRKFHHTDKVKANAECFFYADFCRLWVFRVKGDSQPVELHNKTLNIHLKKLSMAESK